MVYRFHNILLHLDVISMVLWFKVHSNLVFSIKKKRKTYISKKTKPV